MANDLTIDNAKLPAHIQAKIDAGSALADSMAAGIGGAAFPRISLKGSRFRIVEDGAEIILDGNKLEVVVVGANPGLSKTWYSKQWDKDAEPEAPDCFSLNGKYPHPDSVDKQSNICATCPQNAWGSKITPAGKEIKACADHKRLAVVAANDPSGPAYQLNVTPAALKDLNQYHKQLSARGIPPEAVITVLSFDTEASFPKLMFSFGGFLDVDDLALVEDKIGSPEVTEITGENDLEAGADAAEQEAGTSAPTGKKSVTPKKAAPKKAAKEPEPEPEPEEEAEESSEEDDEEAELQAQLEAKRAAIAKKKADAAKAAEDEPDPAEVAAAAEKKRKADKLAKMKAEMEALEAEDGDEDEVEAPKKPAAKKPAAKVAEPNGDLEEEIAGLLGEMADDE